MQAPSRDCLVPLVQMEHSLHPVQTPIKRMKLGFPLYFPSLVQSLFGFKILLGYGEGFESPLQETPQPWPWAREGSVFQRPASACGVDTWVLAERVTPPHCLAK